MKKIALLFLILTACEMPVKPDPQQEHLAMRKEMAKSGQIKWSEYYNEVFTMFEKSNYSDKGFMMQYLVTAISMAKKYESGQISADEFDLYRKQLSADITSVEETKRAQQQQAQREYDDETQRQLFIMRQNQNRRSPQLNCTTTTYGSTAQTNCR